MIPPDQRQTSWKKTVTNMSSHVGNHSSFNRTKGATGDFHSNLHYSMVVFFTWGWRLTQLTNVTDAEQSKCWGCLCSVANSNCLHYAQGAFTVSLMFHQNSLAPTMLPHTYSTGLVFLSLCMCLLVYVHVWICVHMWHACPLSQSLHWSMWAAPHNAMPNC